MIDWLLIYNQWMIDLGLINEWLMKKYIDWLFIIDWFIDDWLMIDYWLIDGWLKKHY